MHATADASKNTPSDFRSDTVTRPDAAMREAMARAEVGDDVFGDDPTVNRLQEEAAALFGKEAALFVPSGSMANLIALKVHTRAGDEVITEATSHMFLNEAGSGAAVAGVQMRPLPGAAGVLEAEAVERAIRPDDAHCPRTSLVTVENTHNFSGGRVQPLENLQSISALTRERGLAFHIDGARIMNACVAGDVEPRIYGALCDTLMFCLSKGLGAPVGSLLLGTAAQIHQAHRVRKMLGGGMRQVGVLAAPGLLALRDGPAQLRRDHAHMQTLARGIAEIPGAIVDLETVDTNILFVRLEGGGEGPRRLQAGLADEGVLAIALGDLGVRFVTHRDVGEADVARALDALRRLVPTITGAA